MRRPPGAVVAEDISNREFRSLLESMRDQSVDCRVRILKCIWLQQPVAALDDLFDVLGNVWEWTLDRRQPYPTDGRVREDLEDSVLLVSNDVARTRRGGSFAYEWFTVRSAHRGDVTYFPNQTRDNVGFRVARTMP
jgi:hypothetical protein